MHGLLCDLQVFLLSVMSFENRIFVFSLPTTEVGKKKPLRWLHFPAPQSLRNSTRPITDILHSSSLSRQAESTHSWNLCFVRTFLHFQPLSPFWIHLPQNKVIKNVSLDLSLFFFVVLGALSWVLNLHFFFSNVMRCLFC